MKMILLILLVLLYALIGFAVIGGMIYYGRLAHYDFRDITRKDTDYALQLKEEERKQYRRRRGIVYVLEAVLIGSMGVVMVLRIISPGEISPGEIWDFIGASLIGLVILVDKGLLWLLGRKYF